LKTEHSSGQKPGSVKSAQTSSKPVSARELDEFGAVGNLPFERLIEAVGAFATKRRISRAMVGYGLFRRGSITHKTWNELTIRFKEDWQAQKLREAIKQAAKDVLASQLRRPSGLSRNPRIPHDGLILVWRSRPEAMLFVL